MYHVVLPAVTVTHNAAPLLHHQDVVVVTLIILDTALGLEILVTHSPSTTNHLVNNILSLGNFNVAPGARHTWHTLGIIYNLQINIMLFMICVWVTSHGCNMEEVNY